MTRLRRYPTPSGAPVPMHKVAAWGAHLLALEHHHLTFAAACCADMDDHAFHRERENHFSNLSAGLRDGSIKFLPGLTENGHAMCYRKAVEALLP